jgi:putative two-component system response regulator
LVSPEERHPTILVADDDAEFLEFISAVLQKQGYTVICAEDGNEALEVILHEPVDLILLDVYMPQWNGVALCRIIKASAQTRLIPVVLLTGDVSPDIRIEGIEAGANDFLTKPVNMQELFARLRSLLRLKFFTDEMEHAEAVLFSLANSIEARDPYTRGHCARLSSYSVSLAERLELPEELRVALRRAGVVHDIGKVVVPDQILLKSGPLTPQEWRVLRLHPVVGAEICAPLRTFRHVLPIIRHHHERMDGTGYPDGLRGDQIPITARILTTVDVFDALTTRRPYKPPFPVSMALELMRDEARIGALDLSLLEMFESLILDPALALLKSQEYLI